MSDGAPPDTVRSVALGSDHSCVPVRLALGRYLATLGYRVVDVGCPDGVKADYPDIAVAVSRRVLSGDCERGIVLDGAGVGSCMAANKVRGIRAALCHDLRTAVN
ncbi:MAG: RpiB/LacA/LacB family sugar-phosphate isomerase, partial [Spirochaetes bacterium]|nr:RpiB/LacA/LacB family sugar-phosphate isomerase [Spirochaetota bacterium]